MKRKILFSILMVFVTFIFAVSVNAAISIPNTTKAKAPKNPPSTSTVLYGTVTENFDFRLVEFEPKTGSTAIQGKKDLKKIILGELKSSSTDGFGTTLDNTFENWFTAYCLDNSKKYPLYGILTNDYYSSATSAELKLDEAVLAAIATDKKAQDAINAKSSLTSGSVAIFTVVELDDDQTVVERFYELDTPDTAQGVVDAINNLTTEVTIKLKKIVFQKGLSQEIVVTAADITGNSSATTYDLKFKGIDILFEKYNVTEYNSVKGYDHALWIIEHSYPTLPLKTAVEAAGGDYDHLRVEICTAMGQYNTTTETCGKSDIDDYVENYVYGVVQYAIWKATDHTVDGEELGSSLANKTALSELNKLYEYLIKDRSEYSGYSTKDFKNTISVKAPKEKEELYKETSSSYIYGPYKVSYDVLAGGNMELSVTNADKTGIKLINANGDEISTLEKGGTFFIECAKKQKISSVTVSIKLNGASVFDPKTHRGRIYFPRLKIEQNVMSGGKIVNKDLETRVELLTNPQTGVENVALLLMVTLVAFTLAYLILSYKQKSVQLN